MLHRAVLLSDLHLASNPELDGFRRDDDLDALVDLPLLRTGHDPVDLVLLGDTFDLRPSVSGAEREAAPGEDAPLDEASEARRLAEAAARHPLCLQAWRRFAARRGARLVFVAGDHDRALVSPAVQAALAAALGLRLGPRLRVREAYDAPELALHAEHGHRYDRDGAVDVAWAEGLFADGPCARAPLAVPAVLFVVFGHTHHALRRTLSNGVTYLNAGSWTAASGPLPLIVAEASGGGPTARLVHLAAGAPVDEALEPAAQLGAP